MFEWLFQAFDFVLGPLTVFKPILSLLLVSTLLTIIVILINRIFVNKDLLKNIKNRMDEIRENLTKAQKDGRSEDASKLLSDMMKSNNEYMKHTLKALIISLVVIALFFPWIQYKFQGMNVATLPFSLPLIGSQLNWVWWYILISLAMGWVIKKLLEGD